MYKMASATNFLISKNVYYILGVLIVTLICHAPLYANENKALIWSGKDSSPHTLTGDVKIGAKRSINGGSCFAFLSNKYSAIKLHETKSPGEHFSLSAFIFVNPDAHKNIRLFSNYKGIGRVGSDVLLIDLLDNGAGKDLRLCLGGSMDRVKLESPFRFNHWHHVAMVFSEGSYTLYFDGAPVKRGTVSMRSISWAEDLRFGEDLDGRISEQFQGYVDDIRYELKAWDDNDIKSMVANELSNAVQNEAIVDTVEFHKKNPKVVFEKASIGTTQMLLDFSTVEDISEFLSFKLGNAPQELTDDLIKKRLAPRSLNSGRSKERQYGLEVNKNENLTLITKTVEIQGGEELIVNANADRGNTSLISIALLDQDNKEIPGYSYQQSQILTSDDENQLVTWTGYRTLPTNEQMIKIKIILSDAALFSIKTRIPQLKSTAPFQAGSNRQLFADKSIIDKIYGEASFFQHRPEDRGVVFTLNKPWEGNTCAFFTILKDGNKYRMYYRGWNHNGRSQTHPVVACYAESDDGINWERPILNQFEFEGSKKNNILDVGPRHQNRQNFTPFIDTNPNAKASERYKAIAGEPWQAYGYTSPDGIHWKMLPKPLIKNIALDSQHIIHFDTNSGMYFAYFRCWTRSRMFSSIRGIMVSTSKDFHNWSTPEWLTYTDPNPANLYTNNVFEYDRAPHLFLGFPCRIAFGNNVEPLFMVSHDGFHFDRSNETIIPAARNPKRWGNRCNYLWNGIVETDSPWEGVKELSIYSGEEYYRGEALILRRFAYRHDGFASVRGSFAGGTVTTVPMNVKGSELLLNYSTAAAGHMVVFVLDANGREIFRTRPLSGDAIDEKISLRRHLDNEVVSLKFSLHDADIFSFKFAE